MPIYDFRCRECGKLSEVFIRGEDSRAGTCPECGSDNMERLLSASYLIRMDGQASGTTCCNRTERCETPPCSSDNVCRRR
jgi:putative FmdB family regulatory protein